MKHGYNNDRVTTALLLAAGTGNRLYPLTQNAPKCLTLVNGIPIIKRLITNLIEHDFKRIVIVTGHLENCIRDYLGDQMGEMKIDYVFSPLYKETNNIYSLWMARKLINEPFLLLESDLVFDGSLLDDMCYPNRIAVAKMQAWLNGSCVTINPSQQLKALYTSNTFPFTEQPYKTVNIYSISLNSWHGIIKRLEKHISDGKVNNYYETVFAEMVEDGSLSFDCVSFDNKPWCEIDTIEDLARAEKIFSSAKFAPARSPALSYSSFIKKKSKETIMNFRRQLA
jgi:choline kinase